MPYMMIYPLFPMYYNNAASTFLSIIHGTVQKACHQKLGLKTRLISNKILSLFVICCYWRHSQYNVTRLYRLFLSSESGLFLLSCFNDGTCVAFFPTVCQCTLCNLPRSTHMMFVSLWVVKWKNSDMRYLGEVLEYGVVQGLNDVSYTCYGLLVFVTVPVGVCLP